jgi:hypothetical protein
MKTDDLIPYERAAALIGVEPKRLLGWLMRNKVGDPIGGETASGIMVYEWSLKTLAERTTNHSDGATDG